MKRKIIIIGVILIMFGIMGLLKGKNTKPKEPIPQEVIEFVKPDKDTRIVFAREWNGYKVYTYDYSEYGPDEIIGLPVYMLFDGKTVRFADDDELTELMILNIQKLNKVS